MPFVRIDVDSTRSTQELKAISDTVYQSIVDTVHAPANDLFHVITKHEPGEMIFDRDYLGIHRTDHFLYIQIFFYAGRTVEQKKLIYQTIAERLHEKVGLRREDVFISVIDTPKENWSYGNGEAQFAPRSDSFAVTPGQIAGSALFLSVVCLSLIILQFRRGKF